MNRFEVFKRWAWSILIVSTLAFAIGGCSGDDGKDGADGAPGQQGPKGDPGDPGDPGPAGPGASATPLESCGVCHDQGSFADAAAAHALPPIELVQNVTFTVDGADLDVNFDLLADDVLTAGYDTVERGYRTDGTTRTTISDSLTLADNGGGNYTITIAGGAAEAATDHRYLFRVSDCGESTTRVYFYGDFPASPVEDLQIAAESCNSCHGEEGIPVHGGYFAQEDGGEPCLTCHGSERLNRDGELEMIPRLMWVAHGYHTGVETWRPDLPEINVTYPTYMNNCSVCHSEGANLTAANALPFSGDCFSCHGDMDHFTEWFKPDGGEGNNPGGLDLSIHFALTPTPETADCSQCHNAAGIAANKLVVTDAHNGQVTERGGIIVNGLDTSITEGEKIDWQITGVVDDGVNLAITWTTSYDGNGVDPCNDTVAAGEPVFFNGNTMRFYRSYAQGDDFIIGLSDGPGQPDRDTLDVNNTVCAGNVATTTIPVDVVDAEKGRLALGGRPLVVSVLDPASTMRVRVPSPTFDWVVGDGAQVLRRSVVDTGQCLGCHVGSLYQHGGDRIDNVNMCLVCHNAAANEQFVRVPMGVDASEAYDGKVGEAFELKTMLHRVHSANWDWNPDREITEVNPPYLVYRNRGVYAFAGENEFPPNWESGEDCVHPSGRQGRRVFGADITNDQDDNSCQPHIFHAPTFPRTLNDCTACHTVDNPDTPNVDEDFMVIPDQTKSMASTVDVGGTVDYSEQDDDVLQGAATTACVTCHYNTATRGHAYQNSWEPQEFPEGRQTIIDAGN
jgi:OmcA/MtrC family decaheme c-type cytochrome